MGKYISMLRFFNTKSFAWSLGTVRSNDLILLFHCWISSLFTVDLRFAWTFLDEKQFLWLKSNIKPFEQLKFGIYYKFLYFSRNACMQMKLKVLISKYLTRINYICPYKFRKCFLLGKNTSSFAFKTSFDAVIQIMLDFSFLCSNCWAWELVLICKKRTIAIFLVLK